MTTATPTTDTLCNLGPISLIPLGEGRLFQVGLHTVAVFRARDGRLYATQALCPHRGGPLADGLTGDGKVICPLHAYKFDLLTGEPVGNQCAALKTYPVFVSADGDILCDLDEQQASCG